MKLIGIYLLYRYSLSRAQFILLSCKEGQMVLHEEKIEITCTCNLCMCLFSTYDRWGWCRRLFHYQDLTSPLQRGKS